MSLLLASLLLTQTWAWDATPGATAYRLYWSRYPNQWCPSNMKEFPASVCVDGVCHGEAPVHPWNLTFLMVTAVNENGEGPTDHGPLVCQ